MAAYLKEHVDPHFTNHERTPAALATTDRELDRAIDLLIDCVKRYYWIVSDAYIDPRRQLQRRSIGGVPFCVDRAKVSTKLRRKHI